MFNSVCCVSLRYVNPRSPSSSSSSPFPVCLRRQLRVLFPPPRLVPVSYYRRWREGGGKEGERRGGGGGGLRERGRGGETKRLPYLEVEALENHRTSRARRDASLKQFVSNTALLKAQSFIHFHGIGRGEEGGGLSPALETDTALLPLHQREGW